MLDLIVDVHVHPRLFGLTDEKLLVEVEKAGLTYCVLLATEGDFPALEREEIREKFNRRYKVRSIYSSWDVWSCYGSGYEAVKEFLQSLIKETITSAEVASIVKSYPEKFVGFGSLAPTKNEEYVEMKLEEIERLNLKGIKVLPTIQLFNPVENKNFERICEFSEKKEKVILYHTGCDPGPFEIPEMAEDANPKYLKPILERYKPTIILAHMGSYSAYNPGIWFNEALELMKKYENVWADTSATSFFIFGNEKIVNKIRETVGFDRILFGSDFPAVWGSSISYEVDVIKHCKYLTDEEKEKILGVNAANLLNLKPKK